ncbi:hypothetical protein LLH06_03440 [Mucilaginibacter daejeonensis]|uniref:hypothetical protein n=1 Tax=Mucilaginibacter daejeonensis TaxID=398049 RepID=UPI001D175FE2|nr:hypothetical protein [Mucilaginibacter daejeonensis]UEG54026.1 hypothetical protein LLH06_03440 [Mucilaginibacter daejeonensis]
MANPQSPEHILQRSLRSVQSHHQLTYKTIQVNKSLFSDKDTSVSRSEETL